ncbi:MAG: hypothetical protein MEQ84_10155 [Mesorhizobium sp.]|nr:hypothetical protein [Mesorhizobium sp.]
MLVVDRNVIRRAGLADAAVNASNEFIITDTFLVEMVKHPEQWAKTLRRDFAELGRLGDRLRVSSSLSECLRKEFFEGRPITREEILPPEFQLVLVQLMHSAAEGGDLSETILRKVADQLPALRAEQPPLKIAKERTEDLTRKLAARLQPEILSDLRNGSLHGDAMLGLVEDIARRSYEADCVGNHHRMLPQPQSITRRYFILSVYRAMSWLQRGGLKTAAEEKLHNDAYDDEYVLLGSFFDGVLSGEKRVNEADAALRRIVNSLSSGDISASFQEYKARRCRTL